MIVRAESEGYVWKDNKIMMMMKRESEKSGFFFMLLMLLIIWFQLSM
jgi:hypothetical protein